MNRRGFTLTEVMMTVVIVGVLATLAIPSLTRPVGAGYWRSARDILITTRVAQKVHFHLNNNTYIAPIGSSTTVVDNDKWSAIYMENPNGGLPIIFEVSAVGAGYKAWARRQGTSLCLSVTDTNKDPQPDATAGPGCTKAWQELM